VFENTVPTELFGPKKDEIIREWRKLHNKELYDLCWPGIILVIKSRTMRWAGNVARAVRGEWIQCFVEEACEKLLGRPRHRWEDIIKMCLQEVGWGSTD
jgi:hypothetical protein